MGRHLAASVVVFTLWLGACATGVREAVDDDGGAGAGNTASCSQDTACNHLSDDCNTGRCRAGECVAEAANEQLDCDDGSPCTSSDACVAGNCQPGAPTDCSDLDEACAVGVCDPQQGCTTQPANAGGTCDDGSFCTANDVCDAAGSCAGPDAYDCGAPSSACAQIGCDEAQDACIETPITACVSGDTCCPSGCTATQDSDCNCSTNHGLTAMALSSGGGLAPCCAVTLMNDVVSEPTCSFHWINNGQVPNGAFIEFQWASPVTIGSTYIATQHANMAVCGSAGRNVNSGSVQYWDGNGWVTATTFSAQLDDVAVNLPMPVTTTRLRIFDMTTSPGNGNSMIYEWYVFPVAGCMP